MVWKSFLSLPFILDHTLSVHNFVSWSYLLVPVSLFYFHWFPHLLTLFDQTPSWLFLCRLYDFCSCALDSLASFCLPPSSISWVSKSPAPAAYKKGEVRDRFMFKWILFTEYSTNSLLINILSQRGKFWKGRWADTQKRETEAYFPTVPAYGSFLHASWKPSEITLFGQWVFTDCLRNSWQIIVNLKVRDNIW